MVTLFWAVFPWCQLCWSPLSFEENSVWLALSTPVHAFQLCINQLRKLTSSPYILSTHTGHSLLQWLWLHLNWIWRQQVHVIWVICTAPAICWTQPLQWEQCYQLAGLVIPGPFIACTWEFCYVAHRKKKHRILAKWSLIPLWKYVCQ